MKLLNQKLLVTSAGALWLMLANVAVNGEDIELFVGAGGENSIQSQPNILLILDDSGSMDSEVESQIDYDPSQTYSGNCDPNRVYWESGNNPEPPSSSACTTTDDWVARDQFMCQSAVDAFESMDGGTYTDRMAQYHPGRQFFFWYIDGSWGNLGSNNRYVECQDDWNIPHGNGDSDDLYPRNGNDDDPWTDNPGDGITWGGWGGSGQNYTVYDGNYVNWINGEGAPSTRLEIMQEVASNLVNAVGGVNIGIMSFNFSEGGRVRHAIQDVSSARGSLISTINDLTANNWTPLSETMYEAHQYFRGGSAVYGDNGDDDAFLGEDNDQYDSPIEYSCQKNHVVLLTDGEPTQDHSANSRITSLSDVNGDSFSELTGSGSCDTENYPDHLNPDGGVCLDDVAHYMYEADLSPEDEQQNVTTHTIGFWIDLPVLEQAAARGGGNYYTADDTGTLTSALTSIVTNILETQTTFVAPAVSVNAFNQTRNLDELYFSVFRPSATSHWPGNLKKYRLRSSDGVIIDANGDPAVDGAFFADDSRSIWSQSADGPNVQEGGAASRIPNPRTVYTHLDNASLTAAANRVESANVAITDELLGTGGSDAPSREEVISFMNGLDPNTGDPHHQMGDPLHSRPATVIYGPENDDGRVYFATNEGYLHSIDIATGVEQWAFVPEEFLGNQVAHMVDGTLDNKIYGIDGNIAVQVVANRDNVIENDEKVYVFFGMRRGGNFYYGLDVSNPDQPSVLWRLGPDELPGLGQTWSTPVSARIDIAGVDQNDDNLVLVFGGGYDTSQDTAAASTDATGNAIYIVDSESGDLLWHASAADADLNLATESGRNATMEYSIPADVKVVDINSDGYADRIYAADMGGQVWRFDVSNGQQVDSLVTGGVIAQLGAGGVESPSLAQTRRFYNAPDTAFVSTGEQTFMHVGIGSGYRSHPNSLEHADRFYAIRDYSAFTWLGQNDFDNLDPFEDSDFVDVTSDINASVGTNDAGWKLALSSGEKVLAEAVTFDGEVFFSTFRPGTTGTSCAPSLGVNRQYRVSLYNASPVTNLDGELDSNGDGEPDPFTSADRFTESDGSILSRTTVIFVDDTNGSGGTNVFGITETDSTDLDFDTSPRRTFWTQESVD